jgi:aspartyl-tRNA(Asn)/glutamyl-tRNA(Gln) amidotransferase subunit A
MADELILKNARELGEVLRRRQVSAMEVVEAFVARTEALNGTLNAFITITAEHARQRAREVDTEIRAGKYRGALHGIPYAAKDVLATRGIRTSNGSKVTAEWIPDHESTVTQRLNDAGAVLIGKLNLREFATGSGVLSGFGTVHNPWAPGYSPAGSSSGSGAAVAARMAPVTIGTDTGGSIRSPAAACGIVGLKPTYGRVSLYGVTTLSWSLDHAGPMTATVDDAALTLQVLAGRDPKDPAAASTPVPDYGAALREGLKGVRIGLPRRHFTEGVHPEIDAAFRRALEVLEMRGARVVTVDIPHADLAPAAGALIAMSEAAAFHEKRLRDSPELFDPLVRERLLTARFYPAIDYIKAQRLRTILQSQVSDAFSSCDVIAVPAYSSLTSRLEAPEVARTDVRATEMKGVYRASNSYIANMTGIPALVLPCGFSAGTPALPIGLQLYGRLFDEPMLFRVGHAYQQATDWHQRHPSIPAAR